MPKHFRNGVKLGPKAEPDFLAFSGAGDVHVLESKGRAAFGSFGVVEREVNAARNKALRQVCKVAKVNGVSPVTRTACVFAFDTGGTRGQITDPPSVQRLDYQADMPGLIRQAYATVLDPTFEVHRRPIDGEYEGIEFAPGWWFGIHRAVYRTLRTVEDADSAARFLRLLDNVAEDGEEIEGVRSAGPDGLVLIGDPKPEKIRLYLRSS
jgi:hypothetical protein